MPGAGGRNSQCLSLFPLLLGVGPEETHLLPEDQEERSDLLAWDIREDIPQTGNLDFPGLVPELVPGPRSRQGLGEGRLDVNENAIRKHISIPEG